MEGNPEVPGDEGEVQSEREGGHAGILYEEIAGRRGELEVRRRSELEIAGRRSELEVRRRAFVHQLRSTLTYLINNILCYLYAVI